MNLLTKIKILHFQDSPIFGGTELMTYNLLKNMNKNRFLNEIVFWGEKGLLSEMYEQEGIKTFYLDYYNNNIFRSIIKFISILNKGKYDILHLYGLKANLIGRIFGKIVGVKIIVSALRSKYPSTINYLNNEFLLFLDKITFPLVSCCISNSVGAKDFLISKGFPKEKFKVIYNGIDVDKFNNISKKNDEILLRGNEKIIKLICVANLRPPKGHLYLLQACKILKERGHSFILYLVGDGPLRGELELLVKELNLSSEVYFLGSRDDVPQLLSNSDIFVLPSLFEGMPGAVMEAMAAKLPVVATDVSGTNELVINGKTGFLCSCEDHVDLANKLETLILNPHLRVTFGQYGYARIKNDFTLERMVSEYEKTYISLLESNRYK